MTATIARFLAVWNAAPDGHSRFGLSPLGQRVCLNLVSGSFLFRFYPNCDCFHAVSISPTSWTAWMVW